MEIDIPFILFVSFATIAGIQLFYYWGIFSRTFKKFKAVTPSDSGVSVIICARNDRAFLEDNLPLILSQNHKNFEVIVVNDGSSDGTIDFLDDLAKANSNMKVLHLDIDQRFHRGKKFAQTIGIKAAKHELLVFTDADCKPATEDWLNIMSGHMTSDKSIVLGVGNYRRKASLTNWIIQLETFHSLMLYINCAMAKMPYMGVGRNLSYKRPLFFSVKGFASHQHLLSGDDDLFVNETANKQNTTVCIDPQAFTVSEPKHKLGQWMIQKKRHYSTGKMYKFKHRFILGLYSFSLLLYYVLGVLVVLDGSFLIPVLSIIGFRFLTQAIVLFRNMKVFDYLKYYWVFPFLDIGILLIHIFIGVRGYFSKPLRWNY
ncbi:MAG: glycosyltransferase involved in cell wall biosynthesis [Bacteroidia bacterium]|jgi:glycosyltransferase involved in cell wall biosynthesis